MRGVAAPSRRRHLWTRRVLRGCLAATALLLQHCRVAVVGKTEKTVVLPRFDGTECKGGGSSGAMTLHLSFQPKVCGGAPEQYTPMPFYARGSLVLACSLLLLLPYVLFFGLRAEALYLNSWNLCNVPKYVTIKFGNYHRSAKDHQHDPCLFSNISASRH